MSPDVKKVFNINVTVAVTTRRVPLTVPCKVVIFSDKSVRVFLGDNVELIPGHVKYVGKALNSLRTIVVPAYLSSNSSNNISLPVYYNRSRKSITDSITGIIKIEDR